MREFKIKQSITTRESHILDQYLLEISKVPLISSEHEAELAKRMRGGDTNAREELIKSSMRFVVSVAKQHLHNGLSLNDLINEGNVGLIKATKKFDETKGFRFISYAVWWIRQSIMHAIDENARLVKIPTSKTVELYRLNRAYGQFEAVHEREPSHSEIAELADVKEADIDELLSLVSKKHISFDAAIGENHDPEGTSSLYDIFVSESDIPPDHELAKKESMRLDIERALNTLDSREKEITQMYFGIGYQGASTLEDIAQRFQLTRERVRQIKDSAIKKLSSQRKYLVNHV